MTDNEKKTAARPFFRAFYQGNRLRFALTLALTPKDPVLEKALDLVEDLRMAVEEAGPEQ